MVNCIDLREQFGDRYKIRYEDDCSRDKWLALILCKRGTIGIQGGEYLLASTDVASSRLQKQLLAVPSAAIRADGSDGCNVSFHVRDFDQVAAIMRPRKRRTISPSHLAKLQASNSHTRFKGGTQSHSEDLETHPTHPTDTKAA